MFKMQPKVVKLQFCHFAILQFSWLFGGYSIGGVRNNIFIYYILYILYIIYYNVAHYTHKFTNSQIHKFTFRSKE